MYFNNLLFVFPKSRLAFHLHLEKKKTLTEQLIQFGLFDKHSASHG